VCGVVEKNLRYLFYGQCVPVFYGQCIPTDAATPGCSRVLTCIFSLLRLAKDGPGRRRHGRSLKLKRPPVDRRGPGIRRSRLMVARHSHLRSGRHSRFSPVAVSRRAPALWLPTVWSLRHGRRARLEGVMVWYMVLFGLWFVLRYHGNPSGIGVERGTPSRTAAMPVM